MGSKLSKLNCACTRSPTMEWDSPHKRPRIRKKLDGKLIEEQKAIDELRVTASKLTPSLSRLEQDLVQTQCRDLEKQLSELQIQADKKSRAWQVLGSSLGDVQSEIEQYLQWLQEKDEELSKGEKLSHTVTYVENRILQNKRLMEDLKSRQKILENISTKLENLTHDLSKAERGRIDDMVRTVQDGHKHITKKAQDKSEWLEECLKARETFSINLEKSLKFLAGKEKAAEKLKIPPLKSSDLEKQIEKAKGLLRELVQYESVFGKLEELCLIVEETTDSEGNEEIIKTRRDVNIRYNNLKVFLESMISGCQRSLTGRKQLETDTTKVELWCRETEVKCSGDLKLDVDLEVLDEQRKKYLTLKTEGDDHKTLITEITKRSESFADDLSASDNNVLQQQLRALRERHFQIMTIIEERCQALSSSFKTRADIHQKITESETWLTNAQEDIRRLNRPIGHSVQDATQALKEYKMLKEQLTNYRPSVANLNQSVESLRSAGHVTDAEDILRITTQHEWLMDQADQYMTQCEQAITLRQQFMDQSSQVDALAAECDQEIQNVMQSNDTVTVKLDKLKTILKKLQSAEPLVTVLQDKSQQITMEGDKENSQSLNSQIVTLQTRLTELRTLVHEETLACEQLQHDEEDFETEIGQTIGWMEEKYQTLLTKPALELDAEKVELALKRHKNVSEDILNTLGAVRSKIELEKTKFEQAGEPLPEKLQAKLDKLNKLEEDILSAIEDKEQYLLEAKADRVQLESSLRQVTEWLHGAEDLVSTNQEGLDYDTLYQQLEEHKEYFMEASLCEDEMEQILELSERLLPTLDQNDQTTLQQSLTNINQKINICVTSAQKRQELLEKKVSEWRDYELATQRVVHILDQLEEQWQSVNVGVVRGPDDTNQQLKHSQEFMELLEKHRTAVEELNSKSQGLDQYASMGSRDNLSQTLSQVNERWNILVSQAEDKQGSLQEIDKDFESYKDLVASLERHLSEVDLDMPTTEVTTLTGQQLNSALQDAKTQNERLLVIQPQIATLRKQAQVLQEKLPGAEARVHVQERMMELIERYERVSETVKDREQSAQDEVSEREVVQAELDQTTAWLKDAQLQLSNLRPGKDKLQMQERIEKQKLLEQEVAIRMEQMKRLMAAEETKYTSNHRELPTELKTKFETLEKQRQVLTIAMREKEEELLHLREDRQEFESLLKLVNTWLDEGLTQVKQPIKDLADSNQKNQEFLTKFGNFQEKLAALKEVGREISLHTADQTEKEATQKSFSKVSKKWANLQKLSSERTEDLTRALSIKELIDAKLEEVTSWTNKTEKLISTKLVVKSFEDVKLKLQENKVLVKDGERFLGRITELRSSVNDLGKFCDASSISHKMADLTKRIQLIQSQLADRVHLLEQANIEVLQYERDTAEVYHWIDQTRAHLMTKDTGLSLKVQLEKQEQLLDEIESRKVQAKTVLENPPKTLGLKRVNPHDSARLLQQIHHLSQHASDQLEQLQDAVQIEEQYEKEIEDLTSAIETAQRQLSGSSVTVATVEGLRQQMAEHTALLSTSLPNLPAMSGLMRSRTSSIGGKRHSLRGGELSRQDKLSQMNMSWNTLQQQLGAKEKELQAALEKQEKYQDFVKAVSDRLETIQSKVSSSLPTNQRDLKLHLEEHKMMVVELQTVRDDLKQIREKGRQIMETSDPEGYRAMKATMNMLGDRVKTLETGVEEKGRQLHLAEKKHEKHEIEKKAYIKRVKDLETWLTQAQQDVQGVAIPGESADKLKYQLQENKNLQNELSTRFQQLSDLAVQCDNLCEMESPVGADRLRRQLADIQSTLGEFKLETLENHSRLKAACKESEKREHEMGEYEGSVQKLQQWITETRRLSMTPLSAEVSAKFSEDQQELKKLESNLQEHRKLVRSLSKSGLKVKGNLSSEALEERASLPVSSTELQWRWKTLSRDLEQKRLDSQETMDSPWPSRYVAMETRSLLLSSQVDPTVTQLADIHRVLADLNECWRHMQTEVKDKQIRLDEALEFQERFQDALLSASTWLDSVELKLTTPDYGKSSEEKMKETEDVLKEIRALQQEILTISKVSQQLLSEGSGNKVLITQSLTDLNERVKLLEARAYKREAEISHSETRWGEIRSEVQDFRKNLNEVCVEFDTTLGEDSLENRLKKNKKLEDQILRYEAQLNLLEEKGRCLAQSNPRMSVNTELTILRNSIAEIRRRVHENREELRQFANVQEQYGNILSDYEGFLETAREKLRPEVVSAKNLTHLNQQVVAHKEFFADLEEHKSMVERSSLLCAPETIARHQVQQQRLNNLTKTIRDKASLQTQRLDRLSRLWTDLSDKIQNMKQFIEDVLRELPAPVSEEDTVQSIEFKYETFRTLQNSLNDEKPLVHEIVEKGKEILHGVNCPQLEKTVTDLADRFVDLHSKVSTELHRAETLVDQWKTFEADSTVLQSWFVTANGQLSSLKQVTDKDLENISFIRSKVDKLLEFRKEVDLQLPLKNKIINVGQQLLRTRTADTNSLETKLEDIEEKWGQLSHDIDTAEESLHQTQMELMPSRQALNELLLWLDGVEKSIHDDKDRPIRSLADIENMFKKYKGFKIDLNSKQLTVDFVNQTVLHLSQEAIGKTGDKTEFAEKLGQLNKRWQILDNDVSAKLKTLEGQRNKWLDFDKGTKSLQDWLVTQEDRVKKFQLIGNEMHVRQTLRDCKTLEESLKNKEDEIEMTRRLGLTLMETESPASLGTVEKIHTDWTTLTGQVHQLQEVLTGVLGQWSDYHSELSSLTHVMNETDFSLSRLISVSPDLHQLKVQVQKLKMLQNTLECRQPEVEKLSTLSHQLQKVCDDSIRQDLQNTLKDLQLRWKNLETDVGSRLERFSRCLVQWNEYESEHLRLLEWLAEKERLFNKLNSMRDDPHLTQQCLQESQTLQVELENFPSRLSTLVKLGDEFTENLDTPVSGPITSQQAKLTQRAEKLQHSIIKHTSRIQDDVTDQTHFQEHLNTVAEFLQNCETILKADDPDRSAESTQVKQRMNQLKELLALFTNNESKMDTLNDLGYRLALSEVYSEKLLQLNHQWQNLHMDAADRYRRMQAVLLLQQDFAEKVGNWMKFLDQAQSDLTNEIAGNYDDLLEQQKKSELFESEIFSRQQILQAIIKDGQIKLRQGDVTNPDDFQAKLAMLSSQWQNVVKQSNHRKSMIDKAVLQWQTYRALRDRLRSWLRNREQDLKTYDFENVSLQKVKYLLEKARSNLKEYKSHEENYRKLHEVSQDILQRADASTKSEIEKCLSDLQKSWFGTFGQFDGQRERLEELLKQWQLCEAELEEMLSWLRDLRRTLSADLPNSYDDLQKDLLLCKEIENSFGKAETKRQALLAKERQLQSVVEAVDLSVLRERIRLLNKQWDEMRHQATLRSHRIQDKLHEWSGFNEKYRELSDWMEEMEAKVSSRTEYHVEDLLLKIQRDYRFEMDTKEQAKLELVNQGRELMKSSSEVRATDINNKVARLEDKWRHLKSVIAYRQHKLQETLLAVQQLENSMVILRKWLSDMEHELNSPVIYHDSDINEIKRKLSHQQEIQKDIEKHSAGVASVLNLCEVLLRDSDACPTEIEYAALQQASRTLDKRWRNICQLAADRRYKIDETWRMWQQFETETTKFSEWGKDVQLQLREPRSEHADVALLKEDVRHFESVQKKVHSNLSQLETINKQYRKMAREGRTDNSGKMKTKMQDANDQWDSLSQRVTEIMRQLKQPSGMKADFLTTRTTILRWFKETEMKLTEIEQSTEMDLTTRITEMKEIETEIETNRRRIEYINETALYLIEKGDPSEAAEIQDLLDQFHVYQRTVLQKIHTYQVKLKKISDGQMETISKRSPTRESGRSTERETIHVEKHKSSWQTRKEESTSWTLEESERYRLSPPESPPEKRRATARVSPRSGSRHQSGEVTETGYMTREERRKFLMKEFETRGRLAHVDDIIERLVESLEDAAEKLGMTERELRCQTPTGPDTDYAPGNYAELVADCEDSITIVHRFERELKQEAGVSSMPSVDAQITSVVQRWEILQTKAVEKDYRLHQNREDWAQFQIDLNNMLIWLDESEAFLENESLGSGEMTLLESVVRRHKDFLLQLESKKKIIMSLNMVGKNFMYNKSDECLHVRERLRVMNRRWESVCSKATLLHRDLQLGLAHSQDFQQMIHDLLLWLERVEAKLQQIEPVSLAADQAILQAKYRRLLDLKEDMEDHQPEVIALKETADQLLLTTESPDMAMARDKTRIIANRLRSLMKRCLTYIRQLETTLGLKTRTSSANYDYLDSIDSDLTSSGRSSPRLRGAGASAYPRRPRSAVAYARQLLFGARAEEYDQEGNTTTLTDGRRRPAYLTRVIRTALPLQVLMLMLLGLACLVPICEEDYACLLMNNLDRSWTPLLRYSDGPPPI